MGWYNRCMSVSGNHSKQLHQGGFASIIVTMIIMSILLVITVGFVRFMAREQRQSLDRQLSTQAFYAAESGVNDAVENLDEIEVDENGKKDTCDVLKAPFNGGVLSSDDDTVAYTCVLVDKKPTFLRYDTVDQVSGQVLNIQAESAIDSIIISWQALDVGSGGESLSFPENREVGNFNNIDNWNHDTGVLRIALTPLNGTGVDMRRDSLVFNTYTAFLYPTDSTTIGSATTRYIGGSDNARNQGEIVPASCNSDNTPKMCKVTITGLSANHYVLAMRSIYKNSSVVVSAQNVGEDELELINAQAVIDVTGRASDVLRRIQVRVPLSSEIDNPSFAMFTQPGFAIQAKEVCKRYSVLPNGGTAECTLDSNP
jgi:Tfp pilus assembly protein PilX